MLLVLAGIALLASRPRAGRALICAGAAFMLILSVPLVGGTLLAYLEPPFTEPLVQRADAIVILGGGSHPAAPEYGRDTVNSTTLERLRYGAKLYRLTRLPVLVTGGNPRGYKESEAQQMRLVLEEEWNVPVRWSDDAARDTADNAANSFALLGAAGITRIYLVTHAWHMPRARTAFERAGFSVVPAATGFAVPRDRRLDEFIPSADGFVLSARFCHEVLGAIWYRLRSF
jgi:uncharacterized SAM-binding protein YcdF (DUF218 family)